MRGGALIACLAGLLAGAPAVAQVITEASYAAPTTAYPHGALGDDEEWSELHVTVSREAGREGGLFHGKTSLTYHIKALPDMVYEDTRPRLWDIDGDAKPEVVVVTSHQKYGAQLAVIAYRDGKFTFLAATPLIGTRFRWLAPVGAADLDGDGHIEVALVHTPHLGKTLHVWRYRNGEFIQVATRAGLTNHKIGWDHIPGGIRDCGDRPEIITASGDWVRIIASTLENGAVRTRDIGAYRGADSLNAALNCQ